MINDLPFKTLSNIHKQLWMLSFLSLLFINYNSGQQVKVVADEFKKPISYAQISTRSNLKLVTTNRKGVFVINQNYSKYDTIVISALGYKTRYLATRSLIDTIKLNKIESTLDTVIVWSNTKRFKTKFSRCSSMFNSQFIEPGSELLNTVNIMDKGFRGFDLEELTIRIKRPRGYPKANFKNRKAILRLNIYSDSTYQTKILENIVDVGDLHKNQKITFEFDNLVELNKSQLHFGIELIGFDDMADYRNKDYRKDFIFLGICDATSETFEIVSFQPTNTSKNLARIQVSETDDIVETRNLDISLGLIN